MAPAPERSPYRNPAASPEPHLPGSRTAGDGQVSQAAGLSPVPGPGSAPASCATPWTPSFVNSPQLPQALPASSSVSAGSPAKALRSHNPQAQRQQQEQPKTPVEAHHLFGPRAQVNAGHGG